MLIRWLTEYASPVFLAAGQGKELGLLTAWIGAIAYTFQLYFDFSGYSDMAIGLSKLFGVNLPLNFSSPYKANCIIDFWKRWHMTLSQFLRDYLYIPLGGNRKGGLRRYVNLVLTMVLGGLWHGANWTFVVWGGLHGLYLTINHACRHYFGINRGRVTDVLGVVATFLAVTVAWVVFRADSLEAAARILRGMIGLNGVSLPMSLNSLAGIIPSLSSFVRFDGLSPELATPFAALPLGAWIGGAAVVVWFMPNSQEIMSRLEAVPEGPRLRMLSTVCGLVFAISILSLSRASEFLYFQF